MSTYISISKMGERNVTTTPAIKKIFSGGAMGSQSQATPKGHRQGNAPLDDANVTRFCNLLDELTKITSTRFIIVTHHALTMSKMDRLYGVTMPEKGISQLVAVDLQKAESMVA